MNVGTAFDLVGARARLPSGLLSAEESGCAARALRAWPAALHRALAARVVEIVRQWAESWQLPGSFDVLSDGSDGTSFDGRDLVAFEDWNSSSAALSPVPLWWSVRVNETAALPLRLLYAAMFDDSGIGVAGDRMADVLVAEAWQDLFGRLISLLAANAAPGNIRPRSPQASAVLDGDVLVRLSWLVGELRLVIGGDLVQSWVAENEQAAPAAESGRRAAVTTPVPLLRALDHQPVALCVELSLVNIDVGALIALQVGDVLCTGHSLDSPLAVRAATGAMPSPRRALCAGYLGARDGWRAIELRRDDASSTTDSQHALHPSLQIR